MPVHYKKEKPNTPAYNKAMREHKALKEVFDEKEYEFISFSIDGPQAVIQFKR